MDEVLREIRSLSTKLTSTSWSFDPKFRKPCKTLLKLARALCYQDAWICKLSASAIGGIWWKAGLCNCYLTTLIRVHCLLQDCNFPSSPKYDYSSMEFWALWLELFWFQKILEGSGSNLDTMCLNDDLHLVIDMDRFQLDCVPPTRAAFEIQKPGEVDFIQDGIIRNRDRYGCVQKVTLRGSGDFVFASKTIDPTCMEEIDIHLTLNHPNIVRAKAWCHKGMPIPVLIIELMDKDLRKWITEQHPCLNGRESRFCNRSQLNWEYIIVAVSILYQIAQAMRYVKMQNVAHRDLKTENILVKEEKHEGRSLSYFVTVKLADFGNSKMKQDGRFTTAKSGTRYYRAPEVMEAEHHGKYSFEADVWSFGVIAWELLTGDTPSCDAKPQRWPEDGLIHPYLIGCIQRCWEKKPGKRPTFESICRTMQYLKRTMFRDKGVYHASFNVLAGMSASKLAEQYALYENNLEIWWMSVLANDLKRAIPLVKFNPLGFNAKKVTHFIDNSIRSNSTKGYFLLCECYLRGPLSARVSVNSDATDNHSSHCGDINGITNVTSLLTSSSSSNSSSHSSPRSNNSTCYTGECSSQNAHPNVRNLSIDPGPSLSGIDEDDPEVQELCSQTAFENAALLACKFVENTFEVCSKETSNSIKLFFKLLAARLHRQRYGCEPCSSRLHFM